MGSLGALSTFIESQKTLLTRTQADIARLRDLRNDIADTPHDMCSIDVFSDKVRLVAQLIAVGVLTVA